MVILPEARLTRRSRGFHVEIQSGIEQISNDGVELRQRSEL